VICDTSDYNIQLQDSINDQCKSNDKICTTKEGSEHNCRGYSMFVQQMGNIVISQQTPMITTTN